MADAIPLPLDAEETWRPVVGYEGLYEVSDHGRVRRVATGKILRFGMSAGSGKPSSKGYRTCALYRDGKPQRFRVHTLVLAAFIGRRPDGHECNHKDGDKANNHASNLEWVTPAQNKEHAARMGLMPATGRWGERAFNVKLTSEQVSEIRQLRGILSYEKLAAKFGVSASQIGRIMSGENWPT